MQVQTETVFRKEISFLFPSGFISFADRMFQIPIHAEQPPFDQMGVNNQFFTLIFAAKWAQVSFFLEALTSPQTHPPNPTPSPSRVGE
jgi:hypothetical protein